MYRFSPFLLVFSFLLGFNPVFGQESSFLSQEIKINRLIDGTLLIPEASTPIPLVIIIGGSGPTDRDGNQPMMKNNALKFLSEALYKNNIASFRYDKRIIKLIQQRDFSEGDIRFENFIEDAVSVLKHFEKDKRFSKRYIIGHSQGSLIGMVAAQEGADGFISIAGAGQSIDNVIIDQLAAQAPGLKDSAIDAFDDLRITGRSENFNPGLASIFRKEIQPFIFSWMQYNPQDELKKLDIPIFIINGDKDFQVQLSEAKLLHQAKPSAKYLIIPNMNHVLKEVSDMGLENQKSYNIHHLPIITLLPSAIVEFILETSH